MAGELRIGQAATEPIVDATTFSEVRAGQIATEPIVDAASFAETRIGQIAIEVIRTFGCIGTPPAGGIYKIVPLKRNDTLWLDPSEGTTEIVKIPDPFVETAALGE